MGAVTSSIEGGAKMAMLTEGTILIEDGYSRAKEPLLLAVRPMTLDEIKALPSGGHAEFIANDGTLRRVKINGAVKLWRRDPQRVEVSVKYGQYEYARWDTSEALRRFVVRI